jgi:DNA primase
LIPDHVLDQVRHANDIVDVIGSYLPNLKRTGSTFKTLCPFHKEKTPSFNVNPNMQLFKCFGCGVGGDVFKFVMLWDRLEFREAVELLAKRANIPLEFGPDRDRGAAPQKAQLYKLHDEAADFFHWQLMKEPAAQIARDYLRKRKVTMEAAREFMLGYAPDAWDATLQWGASRKHPPQLLTLAGLVIEREGGGYYDRFRGRLMFPIRDEQARVIGFSGRVLAGDEKQAKYVNSPESPIFTKGRVLYGLDKTKRALVDAKQAIVCEGQLDLIACYTGGVQNIVASQGTAFTDDHGRILRRYVDEVVLCFDSDAAGQGAAVKSVDPLLAAGLVVRVATMPAGHDPDSLVREEGPEKLRAVIAAARPFFDFYLDHLCARHDPRSDTGKVQISRGLAESLMKVSNAVLRATYVQRSAARLGVPEAALLEEMGKLRRGRERERAVELPPEADAPPDQPPRPAPLPAEKMLLQLMLSCKGVAAPACEALNPRWLTSSAAGEMLAEIHRLQAAGQWRGPDQLLDEFPDAQELLAELLVGFREPPAPQQAALDCVQALRRRWTQARIEVLTRQLGQPDLSPEQILAIQKQILDLRR